MPTMGSITVNKVDGVTTLTYDAATPSAGDRVPARWNANSVSSVAGFRPTFTAVTRDNGQGNGRILEVNAAYPHTQTIAGVETLRAKTTMKASFTLPNNVAVADVTEAYWEFVGLLYSDLMQDVAETGYSPT